MEIKYINEIWKPVIVVRIDGTIIDFTGLYEVSNYGRVKGVDRYNYRFIKGKIRSTTVNNCGYVMVSLRKNGKLYNLLIHRLVATAFLPNPNNYTEVNHKDENKLNNCVDNLEWCSKSYNQNYGTRNNIAGNKCSKILKGKFNTKKSKPILQYDLDGNLIKEWPSTAEVKRQLGFATSYIYYCLEGKYKQAYGYLWKRKEALN